MEVGREVDNMATGTKRSRSFVDEKDLGCLLVLNYVTLTDELQTEEVIRHLIQNKILSIADKQEILGHTTSKGKAIALVDKLIGQGKCSVSQFLDILRRSGHGHLADMLEEARAEGILDMTDSQLEDLRSRLRKVYRKEAERHEGGTSLEGLMVHEMDHDNSTMLIGTLTGTDLVSFEQCRRLLVYVPPSLVVKEEADRHAGTALVADWVGDKKVTSDFEEVYKLQLDKVQKDDTIIDAISAQLLHDHNYSHKRFFSKESLWKHMVKTQEKILFVLEGLDRLNPFTSPEILQLIDKKLLPRATVIVTVAEANGG